MKRYAFVGVGAAAGFAAAMMVFPAVYGATDLSTYRKLDVFSDAFELVRQNYVRPVEDKELINNAIEGMVSSLDPHSSYMDAKAFADMQIQTKGEFAGLGLEVTMEDGLVKVISPIDDTPAAKAGLKTGDFIAAIDSTPIQGMSLNDAIEKMRGQSGTKVSLTILRPGAKKPFDVTLTRAVVHVDSVKFHKEGDVGYIRIAAFNEHTDDGVRHAIKELKQQIGGGLKGYVIDLRNDPGGLLDQAIAVSGDFLSGGEVVSTRGRHPEDTQRYDAHSGGDMTGGKPIIVLINGGTASASEIVAGALKDHSRAKVVGMTSFGKGSVQTIIPLGEGGGALRLTTARYFTPSGHSIQAEGIQPDYGVAQTDQEDAAEKALQESEANLPGHLIGEGAKKVKQTIVKPPAGKKFDDFQLTYALDLLHGGKMVASLGAKSAQAN
ncbi:MAG TPA: S41 family peptidase [Rhizomicrobium sp.]|jgi:carboxyl-terminal processing protease